MRAALCPPGGSPDCSLEELPTAWRERLLAEARAARTGNRRLFSDEEIAAIEQGDLSGLADRARIRSEIYLEEVGLAPETARRVIRDDIGAALRDELESRTVSARQRAEQRAALELDRLNRFIELRKQGLVAECMALGLSREACTP